MYIYRFTIPTMGDNIKSYTPGWNDPPSYSFEDSVSAQQENRPKIFDRIPARVLPNIQAIPTNLEKKILPINPDTSSYENSVDEVHNNLEVSSSSSCDIPVAERLTYIITSLNDSIQKSTLPELKKVDISKRLSRLETSWKDNQFTDIVQQKTILLVKAIEKNNFIEANKLQMALMVDHTRQCNTWIPAIRQLINQNS